MPLAVPAMDGAQMDGMACPRNGAGVEGSPKDPSLSQGFFGYFFSSWKK
jgi:hypothetical protein